MKTPFWSPFISDGTIKAICWTLIHSLWIGLIVALLCGIIVATTRKAAAALRYRLLCGVLVLFLASMAITYIIEIGANKTPVLPATPVIVVAVANPSAAQRVTTVLNRGIVDQAKDLLNQNINIVFIAWLLFFMLKSLKMASGLLYIRRIRNHKIHTVTEELKHRFEHLSSQIGIGRSVRLVQSELVKVPVAVGWLKPMILLPVGIVFQLTPEQLDGILWHELAHIRRRDYLVNILQGVLETIFFFNPGLLWLSSLIRTEREACCDDMVLIHMNRKANYLEALLSFGYGEFSQARYAMSVGSGKQLRERLKRMINQENRRLGVIEKVVLVAGVVLLSAFVGMSETNKKFIRRQGSPGAKKETFAKDKVDTSIHLFGRQYEWSKTEPGTTYYLFGADKAGAKYRFTITKFKLAALTVNGSDVRKSDLRKYNYLLNHIPPPPPPPPGTGPSASKADTLVITPTSTYSNRKGNGDTTIIYNVKARDNHGNSYRYIAAGYKLMSMSINGKRIKDSDLPHYEYVVRLAREADAANLRAAIEFNQKQSAQNQRIIKQLADQNQRVAQQYTNKPQQLLSPPGVSADKTDTLIHHRSGQPGQSADQQAMPPSLDKMISGITNDLVNANVLKDKNSLSAFKLSNSELVVNGVKQPNELQQRLSVKYLKNTAYPVNTKLFNDPNYGLFYNAKSHGVALGSFKLDLDAL